jgi:hypothetical protein
MDGRRAQKIQSCTVLGGAIPFVAGETVAGMLAIQFDHEPIA